jgi:hypothetical protein
MKLSERIIRTRTDRPDEWSMDAMAVMAARLEKKLDYLEKMISVSYDESVIYSEYSRLVDKMGKAELTDPDQ